MMAIYNNGFPMNYSQMYPAYQPQPAPIQNVQNGRIWVQGEAGARSYLVAPNNSVELWDSESQVIYLKTADASGIPNLKILDYTVRDQAKTAVNTPAIVADDKLSTFATKDEIKAIMEQMTALRDRVDNLTRQKARSEE